MFVSNQLVDIEGRGVGISTNSIRLIVGQSPAISEMQKYDRFT